MILRDSTNPFDIPLDGLDGVAGYGDGPWMWSSDGWARFHGIAIPLSIVIDPAHQGDILDVERFDASPEQCPGWADRFNRPGRRRPTIYCNRRTIGDVRRAMGARKFDWWAATLDGATDGTDGAVAVQYLGSAQTGRHYDETIVLDPTWLLGDASQAPDVPTVDPAKLSVPIPADGGKPVLVIVALGQMHLFYVDGGGKMQYMWQPPGGGSVNSNWSGPLELADGLLPGGLVSGATFGGMMHVYAPEPDGTPRHIYTTLGQADWQQETL